MKVAAFVSLGALASGSDSQIRDEDASASLIQACSLKSPCRKIRIRPCLGRDAGICYGASVKRMKGLRRLSILLKLGGLSFHV